MVGPKTAKQIARLRSRGWSVPSIARYLELPQCVVASHLRIHWPRPIKLPRPQIEAIQ